TDARYIHTGSRRDDHATLSSLFSWDGEKEPQLGNVREHSLLRSLPASLLLAIHSSSGIIPALSARIKKKVSLILKESLLRGISIKERSPFPWI
ncbi:hypothetical protein, partial [Armatimonas sp.]|uniref:hypothetical protein n=1 Tax=Armatimonas sp. TaxID=1872638 RepID=UPI003752ED14